MCSGSSGVPRSSSQSTLTASGSQWGNKQAVDKLDSGMGSKMVAETGSGTPDPLEVPDLIGGPSRTRTLDPLIKRPSSTLAQTQQEPESATTRPLAMSDPYLS